ncbi:MAG: UDP-N-acetylmuramoyl-L-alanine--D-glutamate ligase [Syntrophaceae bacterium]|nr:UDP-N-acetylmuramoyl-L-alanine--D-glutamate ligase [Syntrophaceae bacterium]
MDLKGKKVIVVGMGKTGVAAAAFLGSRGCRVVVTDEKPREMWDAQYERIAGEKWLETGLYNAGILSGADMVVPSPGIPPYNDILMAAVREKIPVVSEIELAYRFMEKPLVAVTGTNGKTTTTTLLGEIFRRAGKKVFVGGNIGNPLIEYAGKSQQDDFVVAEISSFQLQWVEKFRPFVSILLNVTCDHINYHGSFDEYRRIKARIFANQTKTDFAVLNAEDPAQESMSSGLAARVAMFSSAKEIEHGMYLRDNALVFKMFDGSSEQYPLSMIKIPGLHNVENVMAAVMAARFCGCSRDSIIAAVGDFRGLPHRIEFTGEKNNVRFYDDSKGTNVGSVIRALDTFTDPVILLLGGRDKDGDFDTLKPLLTKKAKKVILFGEARDRIGTLIGDTVPAEKTRTLREAIESAYKNAKSGDVILLSPGCASFDEFKNYKERGNFFKETVRNL